MGHARELTTNRAAGVEVVLLGLGDRRISACGARSAVASQLLCTEVSSSTPPSLAMEMRYVGRLSQEPPRHGRGAAGLF